MSAAIVARRYADALHAAVDAAKADAPAVLADLRAWAELLAAPESAALTSPVIKPDVRARALEALVAKLGSSVLVANLVRLCHRKGRLGIIGDIAAAYARLLADRGGLLEGEGISAHPLDAGLQEAIANQLQKTLHRKPRLQWRTDPSLVGGFVVRIGHRVWDASLARQIERLGDTIRKGVI